MPTKNHDSEPEPKTVLSSAPAEAEMFTALEDMRGAIQGRDAEFIKNYRPIVKRQ